MSYLIFPKIKIKSGNDSCGIFVVNTLLTLKIKKLFIKFIIILQYLEWLYGFIQFNSFHGFNFKL